MMSSTAYNFQSQHPDVWGWLEERYPSFEFAHSLRNQVIRKGALTPNQLAAARKCIAGAEAAKARAVNAKSIETDKLMEAFDKALQGKLKKPTLRFEEFKAYLPTMGVNVGKAVYIKTHENEWLGMIKDGKFVPSKSCTRVQLDAVHGAMSDPLAAALAYGARTGRCAVCNRSLEAEKSVDRGIGPVCAKKYGWAS